MLVKNHDELELIGRDLKFLFTSVAIFTSILVVLVLICELIRSLVVASNLLITNYYFQCSFPCSLPASTANTSLSIGCPLSGEVGSQSIIALPPLGEESVLQCELRAVACFVWHER